MNTWQAARQLKHRLVNQAWSGGSRAFGSVVITPRPHEIGRQVGLRLPMAVISPGAGSADEEEPDLIRQSWTVWVVVAVAGDALGETATIGANRAGQTTSAGRGLLELEEVVYDAVNALANEGGFRPLIRQRSALESVADEELGYVAIRGYALESVCTADRFYHPPTRLTATDATGGSASLTWTLPPDRFDRLKVVLRRASGGTPPSSVTAGTGVTLASDLATSVTDSPGAGSYAYALFAQYDDFAADTPTTARNTSASDTATVTVT